MARKSGVAAAGDGKFIIGTSGADRLKGGRYDDTLVGLTGDDKLTGGSGYDTAVFSGSVWDFTWDQGFRQAWSVTDQNIVDGDEGTDTLHDVEALQFDDYTIALGGDNPVVIDAPTVETDPYTPVNFTISAYDVDDPHLQIGSWVGGTSRGYLTIVSKVEEDVGMGSKVSVTYSFDPDTTLSDHKHLALGETVTETKIFRIGSIFDGYTYETVEIVITGLNDVPTLAPGVTLQAFEEGSAISLDLSSFGDDVDSDDDGNSLTYRIVSQPEGFGATLDGSTLKFDPGNDYELLNEGESYIATIGIQAVDRHGAVSEVQEFKIQVNGADDPVPNYLNADGTINYLALGVDPGAAPDLGVLFGAIEDASYLDLIAFTDGDDAKVLNFDRMELFGEFAFLYQSAGVELYDDLTFTTGAGNDKLVLYQRAFDTIIQAVEIDTGAGEDVVVVDAIGEQSAFINFLSIYTGDHNDQILMDVQNGGGDGVLYVHASLQTGSGNDIVNVVMTDTDGSGLGGFSGFHGDVGLGDGHDQLYVDVNALNAIFAEIDFDLYAGKGDDYIYLDNSDSTIIEDNPAPFFEKLGLYGTYDLGAGDDVLDLDMAVLEDEEASAHIYGWDGYDVVNLLNVDAADVTVTEIWNGYTVAYSGQTIHLHYVEEINAADGALVGVVV